MRRAFAAAAVTVVALAGCGTDAASPPTIEAARALMADGRDDAAVVYLTLRASDAGELTGATVDASVARRAQVYNPTGTGEGGHLGHLDPGGSLQGGHTHSLAFAADTEVLLREGGAYIALSGLAGPLVAGDTFELRLQFASGAWVAVDVLVEASP